MTIYTYVYSKNQTHIDFLLNNLYIFYIKKMVYYFNLKEKIYWPENYYTRYQTMQFNNVYSWLININGTFGLLIVLVEKLKFF